MTEAELKKRTKQFALDVMSVVSALPKNKVCDHIGYQLLKSGTSVGANYSSACKGKSKPDFISKLAIAEEEADECQYWIELLVESKQVNPESFRALWKEAKELTAILSASGKTLKAKK